MSVFLISVSSHASSITWSSSNFGGNSGFENNWLVALYEDVDKDGWDATTISTIDGSTDSDDVFLGITTALFVIDGIVEQWTTSFNAPAGSIGVNDNLVSILFNASSYGDHTSFWYDDVFTAVGGTTGPGGSFQLPASDVPASYVVKTMVPEPATAMLLVMGAGLAWLGRSVRKYTAR